MRPSNKAEMIFCQITRIGHFPIPGRLFSSKNARSFECKDIIDITQEKNYLCQVNFSYKALYEKAVSILDDTFHSHH